MRQLDTTSVTFRQIEDSRQIIKNPNQREHRDHGDIAVNQPHHANAAPYARLTLIPPERGPPQAPYWRI